MSSFHDLKKHLAGISKLPQLSGVWLRFHVDVCLFYNLSCAVDLYPVSDLRPLPDLHDIIYTSRVSVLQQFKMGVQPPKNVYTVQK